MEIERKYLPAALPADYEACPNTLIEQAYLCTEPVVRVRRDGSHYYMTYKGGGMLAREEYNLPLTEQAYLHLRSKADGCLISKRRYRIPLSDGLTAELDIFLETLYGLQLIEVEFPSREAADAFIPPEWFGEEVTFDPRYHNSSISRGILPPFVRKTP